MIAVIGRCPDHYLTYCEPCGWVPDIPHATGREPGWVEDGEHATTYDLMAVSGATYRQVDYWTRTNRLQPVVSNPGSGTTRLYPAIEQRVVEMLARLTAAGLDVEVAAHMARLAATTGQHEFTANGVTIKVEESRHDG